ncbi:hypothetical protein AXG93_2482s1130 [Marchantia polymorpha subsp. ruderalis]|uniref:Uncharacterized protein n=1 Tax=Marchantia polymorpha subsp. ruderalis TaxID=1480154 RepID=A0A176VEV5_MARPO|nr:hypothetical protein AXG93_2482s1130 [Marchantia polymorpha subsp. ruderalis]
MKKSLEVSPLDKGPLELFVAAIGKLVSEKPTLSLCQISSGTIEFDMDEVPSACEPKLTKTSLSNLLNERFVLLLKYLNRKMVKYSVSVSLAGSYVELVRRRTKSKATTTAKERMAIAELALWKYRLATYKVARSLKLKRGRELDADCRSLRSQLSAI